MVREGEQMLIGPTLNGGFQGVTVTSVKRNRAACRVVHAGQSASIALSGIDRTLLRRVRTESGKFVAYHDSNNHKLYFA